MEDKQLMEKLKAANFDLMRSCIGELLVRWITNAEGHFEIAPSPISYIPTIGSLVTDKISLANKLKNVLHYGIAIYIDYGITRSLYQGVINKYIDPNTNIYCLIQGADLWLMRVDLSLGSLLGSLLLEISEVIAAAFALLPQKVAINTLLVNWLPQNDLLGHPKTRAFVTHRGTNGIYEAIYHGVPMLGLPLIFDHMLHLQARGVAKVLEVTSLKVEPMTQALTDILDKRKPYRENMHRMSKLHHDTPLKPMDNTIFWLEFAMRHKGAAHLHTESYKIPWYAYHNVDVLVLLLTVVVSVLLLTLMTCKVLGRALC
ncbi:unnamed protein product [Coregonus sp. 'balchen']|nr:unnamed protein product [Coregonus sp. 'balchen']